MKNKIGSTGDHSNLERPELELKKQSHSANMNLMSYQTANFGPNGETRPIGQARDKEREDTGVDEDNDDEYADSTPKGEGGGAEQKAVGATQ